MPDTKYLTAKLQKNKNTNKVIGFKEAFIDNKSIKIVVTFGE